MTTAAPGSPGRRGWWAAAVVLVVALGAGAAWWSAGGGADRGRRGAAPATTATTSVTASPSTVAATAGADADAAALWPEPGSRTRFDDPEAAARSFAIEYLRFEAPEIGAFRSGDARSGEVPVRPRDRGPVTTVLVRQVDARSSWSVVGAASDDIQVTAPTSGVEIRSPLAVAGRAWTFEGNVVVQVHQDGEPGLLGEGVVTGGGAELSPFEGNIAFRAPRSTHGAVWFLERSAEDGRLWQATVVRVAFAIDDAGPGACRDAGGPPPAPDGGEMLVQLYFSCETGDPAAEEPLQAVFRTRPRSAAVLRVAVEELLAGPTAAERGAGLGSWFSPETADLLRSVKLAGGHAVIDVGDLRAVIPNASSSAGSRRLLAQLDATVFQFAAVDSVEYRLDGDCQAFTEWLQIGGCEPRRRPAATG